MGSVTVFIGIPQGDPEPNNPFRPFPSMGNALLDPRLSIFQTIQFIMPAGYNEFLQLNQLDHNFIFSSTGNLTYIDITCNGDFSKTLEFNNLNVNSCILNCPCTVIAKNCTFYRLDLNNNISFSADNCTIASRYNITLDYAVITHSGYTYQINLVRTYFFTSSQIRNPLILFRGNHTLYLQYCIFRCQCDNIFQIDPETQIVVNMNFCNGELRTKYIFGPYIKEAVLKLVGNNFNILSNTRPFYLMYSSDKDAPQSSLVENFFLADFGVSRINLTNGASNTINGFLSFHREGNSKLSFIAGTRDQQNLNKIYNYQPEINISSQGIVIYEPVNNKASSVKLSLPKVVADQTQIKVINKSLARLQVVNNVNDSLDYYIPPNSTVTLTWNQPYFWIA